MILEKIKIDKDVFIYKGNVSAFHLFDKENFIKKIKYIEYIYPNFTLKHGFSHPGKQYPMIVNLEEYDFIIDEVKKSLKNEVGTPTDSIIQSWVYISNNTNEYSGYHTHEKMLLKDKNESVMLDTTMTFTYYLQMPNNLKNDDGYLYFKTNNVEIGFLPKEDEVWIFPPNLEHSPKTNLSSTNERIVIASNIYFFDCNSIKTKKTLL